MKTIESYWTNKANDLLKGSKIIKCEYLSKQDCDQSFWHNSSLAILLQKNKKQFWVIVSQDDEGNDGGALFVEIGDGYETLPRISTNSLNKVM